MGWETFNVLNILTKEELEFLKDFKRKNGITINIQIKKAIERHIALSKLPKERAEFINRLEEFILYPTYSHSKPITIPEITPIIVKQKPKIKYLSVSKKTLNGKILHYLYEHKNATRYELADKFKVARSQISRAINRMMFIGLVNREMGKICHTGRGFYIYSITEKGIFEIQKQH